MTKIVGSVTFLKRSGDPSTEGENTYQGVSILTISEDVFDSIVNGDNYPSNTTLREAHIRVAPPKGKNDNRVSWHKLPMMTKLMLFYRDHTIDNRCDTCRIELSKF